MHLLHCHPPKNGFIRLCLLGQWLATIKSLHNANSCSNFAKPAKMYLLFYYCCTLQYYWLACLVFLFAFLVSKPNLFLLLGSHIPSSVMFKFARASSSKSTNCVRLKLSPAPCQLCLCHKVVDQPLLLKSWHWLHTVGFGKFLGLVYSTNKKPCRPRLLYPGAIKVYLLKKANSSRHDF